MAENTIQNYLDDPTLVDELYKAALDAIAPVLLRKERDTLLDACDWTQSPDSPLSDVKKTEWATYRQELRDLPATASPTIDVNEQLQNVTWPTKPGE
jgi:hypothetical protein